MPDNTSWTPSSEDNLLNLTDQKLINDEESIGLTRAEMYVFEFDITLTLSLNIILDIHREAFGHLYEWAGKWRTTNVLVGGLEPPEPHRIIQLMYQFIDNLSYKISIAKTESDILDCLCYSHYEFIRIHPFNNGNGRTGRILMNSVAMKFGLEPITLYHRDGDGRKKYIAAMKEGDKGNFEPLTNLILSEMLPL